MALSILGLLLQVFASFANLIGRELCGEAVYRGGDAAVWPE
jgi:methane/ammonia monooxygenase subunit C